MDETIADKMARAMTLVSACPGETALDFERRKIDAALAAIDVREHDLSKLASGGYILCDGYCNEDY